MHRVYGDQSGVQQASVLQTLQRSHAVFGEALLDFSECFVQMYLHGQVELACIGCDLRQMFITDGVGGMWGKAEM